MQRKGDIIEFALFLISILHKVVIYLPEGVNCGFIEQYKSLPAEERESKDLAAYTLRFLQKEISTEQEGPIKIADNSLVEMLLRVSHLSIISN